MGLDEKKTKRKTKEFEYSLRQEGDFGKSLSPQYLASQRGKVLEQHQAPVLAGEQAIERPYLSAVRVRPVTTDLLVFETQMGYILA
ncbi:hypothetical protein AMTR_s00086p00093920 [Amborella trichopoda]|uniref:Uncharacterized protein n=1 Tax=Amborella trichopoda TaxID=13333 RepID=W1P738_AMBTC|nr:hypothetical protein AMTR_s00086p00093920 [Amborella trichopoda]